MTLSSPLFSRLTMGAAALWLGGCSNGTPPEPTPGSATAAATASAAPSAAPSASSSAAKPEPSVKPYEGPTGVVKGVVTIKGDEAPVTPFDFPDNCAAAAGMYGKLFRVGQDGQLADAIVAVTHYKGFVPPKQRAVEITIKDCQYSQRSIALTDDQYLEIRNLDSGTSYIPHLDGARLPSTNVAIPQGPSLRMDTRGRGRYWLRDQMTRPFMMAHVFHFPYSTTAVTGLDGRFSIEGVPVGKAKINVMLPQTKTLLSVSKDIEVKEGDNVVDLELTFDAKRDTPDDGHGGTKPKVPAQPPIATPD
ncbi:MAG: hypothetical protein R3B72_25660 [Polyangiaceae bacterium]